MDSLFGEVDGTQVHTCQNRPGLILGDGDDDELIIGGPGARDDVVDHFFRIFGAVGGNNDFHACYSDSIPQ